MRRAIIFRSNRLFYLDQRKLPLHEVWRECRTLKEGWRAIKNLSVRGAPLLGVFAGYCVYVAAREFKGEDIRRFVHYLEDAVAYLRTSRPTAVNLFRTLERMEKVIAAGYRTVASLRTAILNEAKRIHSEDVALCGRMAQYGLRLIKEGDAILTHCNTGFLATSGDGTALAVIYAAARRYKNVKVYADETRPLLQGARLTAWELLKGKVDVTLICDNMAASLMMKGKINKVFVGADRIARNGDVANKIGTYNVAVLCRHHNIPFYVVAPSTTFDLNIERGKDIPIEERNPDEVRKVMGRLPIAPISVNVYNPAFDVTPHRLVTAIVTDCGIIRPPLGKNIKRIVGQKCFR